MATSKLQRALSEALDFRFSQYTIRENSRPSWCLSDTFERLELDFHIIELDVAVEVQGQQHYVYTPHFHQNYDEFKKQLARDVAKKQRCQEYGVELLEVWDDTSFEAAIDRIEELSLQPEKKIRITLAHSFIPHIIKCEADIKAAYNSRKSTTPREFWEAYSQTRHKLIQLVENHGAVIFDACKPKTMDSLFFHLKKSEEWIKNRHKGRRS